MEPTIVTGVTWEDPLMQVARVPPHNITIKLFDCRVQIVWMFDNFVRTSSLDQFYPSLMLTLQTRWLNSKKIQGMYEKIFWEIWRSCWIFQSQAINLINQREKPLALYVFSEYKEVKRPSRNKKGKIFQPIGQRCKNGSSSALQVGGSWSMTHSCISGYHLWAFAWPYFVFT